MLGVIDGNKYQITILCVSQSEDIVFKKIWKNKHSIMK